jgi:outer membrane protein OmpA-like peptidoglycan-associated protein
MERLMHPRPLSRARHHGRSATPILVFLGIVVLSVVFFFALTLPRQLERKRLAADQAREAAAQSAVAAASGTQDTGRSAAPTDDEVAPMVSDAPKPAETGIPVRFASQRQFMQTLATAMSAGDVAVAMDILGPAALTPDKAGFLSTLLGSAGLRPAAASPIRELGDVPDATRWAVRLVPARDDAAASAEMEVDLARDADRGWRAAALHFPEPLRRQVAAMVGEKDVPVDLASTEGQNDPLRIAGRFLDAVLKQDYAVARAITDTELVTREKVAGLCILFEEGGYAVAPERAFSATAAGPDAAWVIVKVVSGRDNQPSDFGLELRRIPAGTWQVAGINFSKLLANYAASAGATDGVAYSPIVKNPGGGESLVVYFDFNEAGLVPRARRQLEIVANLLRDDPRRKLRLSGHADAIGSDTYNRRLSAARALAVKQELAGLGVAAEQIVTEGLGTLRPLDPNTKPDGSDNPEGRSRNRRTEIYLDF